MPVYELELSVGEFASQQRAGVADLVQQTAHRRRLLFRMAAPEAREFRDQVRAARAQVEIDVLSRELKRAVGLAGRDRRAASASVRFIARRE
jgi:hypothetical protein